MFVVEIVYFDNCMLLVTGVDDSCNIYCLLYLSQILNIRPLVISVDSDRSISSILIVISYIIGEDSDLA